MSGDLKITVLGCGGSAGVPASGNYWGACDPNEPRNNRMRCSIAVQSAQTTIIIDTGPDFRHQVNRAGINNLDAVLYTHYHGDHVDGMADLRTFRFRNKALVSIYANAETLDVFERTVPHLLHMQEMVYPQILEAHEIPIQQYGKKMSVGDISFVPFDQDHTTCRTLGYRFGDFAYSVDMVNIESAGLEALRGVKTWLVDGTGYHQDDNIVHASFNKIYQLNQIVGADRVIITSLSLSMDYRTMLGELPPGYEPAYDGLVFEARSD